ncbi:hypothetical protein CBS63078_11146 [Aspergillus niger]|nr:hypothetical protein CBS13152_11075 [Aspergillus niger]GLA78715.1 putative NRPS-like protein biosynthetic cluster [Aspergillus tubingensis]KAI2871224.1 hypothetical protein CBS11852_11008 [Aspergillus niger]KAI2885624.1 hypothetical protein CBS63078_11146 [Aspergillus niger]KAI3015200.1 hypothetical protein CBS147347_11264 [Aspergillus niger]
MEKVICQHAQQTPHATAIKDGNLSLSYAELVTEAIHLAHSLYIAPSEPVAILMSPGAQQVVCQLAVRFAGGTCVPIEPTVPEQRLNDLFHDVNVKLVLTHQTGPYHLGGFQRLHPTRLRDIKPQEYPFKQPHDPCECSHILFTSGSTGKPKPVQIPGRAIMHLATRTPATPLEPTDRVASFNNPGFDLSLFENWVTLVAGATVVVVSRDIATDPGALPAFLRDEAVTVLIITASLFQIVSTRDPSAFASLRHVLTAGDVASVRAMKMVLEHGAPQHLWNTYGPTECTTLATMFEVTSTETERDRISIGGAVGDMEVFLLGEDGQPVRVTQRQGEVYIGGPQQSIGYRNRPGETQCRFVNVKRCHLGQDQSGTVRLYRTGDLAEWRDSEGGCLDFIGRVDHQVKHLGFRVELGEIERVLLSFDGMESVTVVRVPSLSPDGMHALVAFVCGSKGVQMRDLAEFARQRLPFYMVPNAIEPVPEFPLTQNGKVDRKALAERWQKTTQEGSRSPQADTNSHDAVIRHLWKALLNVSEVRDQDDFFALGASSLQAAAFISQVHEKLGLLISMEELYSYSRLDHLERFLKLAGPGDSGYAPDETQTWMDDINLVQDIQLIPEWEAANEGRVFVTGVTGFVGAHLLEHLMHRPGVQQIACLVRSKNGLSPATRLQRALEKYDLWPDSFALTQKLQILDGDLTDRTFMLGDEKFTWLANWASIVFHLGAKVNFCESYREHSQPNVVGMCNALRLAATGRRKTFHYVSSIDAWGPTGCILGTRELWEDEPLQPHVQGLRYDLGYAQSQWTAEGMARRMADRGLPIVIHRPGFIIGDSRRGTSNPDDFFSRLLVGCIQMGIFPHLDQCLEYVTVDYVIDSMMQIASQPESIGHCYHVLSPDNSKSVTVEQTCRVMNEAGYTVRMVEYGEWAKQAARLQRDGPLAPLMPMFQERVLGRLTRWEASQYSPVYRCDNLVDALKGNPEIQYVPFGPELLQRFIDFWNRKGYYDVQTH